MSETVDIHVGKPMRESGSAQPPTIDQLSAIWSRVLQISPIFPETNFFDAGGDSLLATGLMLEIERETGHAIPFTAIYDAPSVKELAALLEEWHAPQFSPLVCLKEGEGAPPFFIVHGIGGTVMELAKLGKLIDYTGAVYGIQARGVDGTQPPLESIPEMAACYLEAIRNEHMSGPYFLSGYSFGGLIALEMSRQLQECGEETGLLVLIDAYPHPRLWPMHTRLAVRWRRAQYRFAQLAKLPLRETISYALQKVQHLKGRLPLVGRGGMSSTDEAVSRWLRDRSDHLPPELREVREAGGAALRTYVPQRYLGKITFLRAENPDPDFPSWPEPVWRKRVLSIERHTVRGSHFTIVGEHAASIASRLSQCLAEASHVRCASGSSPLASLYPSQLPSMKAARY
jgi:acetoacetyl-CoA synthetase